MENNLLNWFRTTFQINIDENGSLIVSSKESCFMKDLEHQLLAARRKDIINVLKILSDNFPISDGGNCWLDTEEDFERTANEIIEFEKLYYGK